MEIKKRVFNFPGKFSFRKINGHKKFKSNPQEKMTSD